jgi:integrase
VLGPGRRAERHAAAAADADAVDRAGAGHDHPRGAHATLGLAAGVSPKVMSGRLGHVAVAFTQDVYVHAMPEREQEAADIVAALFADG